MFIKKLKKKNTYFKRVKHTVTSFRNSYLQFRALAYAVGRYLYRPRDFNYKTQYPDNSHIRINKQCAGFSLVELILVVVILGIVSVGTVQYLSLGALIYADATERDEVVAQGRFMLTRLTKELRHAAPNSVRLSCDNSAGNLCNTGSQCMEFTPFKASSIYIEDLNTATINVIEPLDYTTSTANSNNDNAVVYALNAADIYDSAAGKRIVINSAVNNTAQPTYVDDWTMAAIFPEESPTKRIFVLDLPVTFCVEGSELYRYQGYGFNTNQALPNASHVLSGTTGVLMGSFIQNNLLTPGVGDATFFNYNSASLTRNSVLNVKAELSFNSSETVALNHEIHLVNVP